MTNLHDSDGVSALLVDNVDAAGRLRFRVSSIIRVNSSLYLRLCSSRSDDEGRSRLWLFQ